MKKIFSQVGFEDLDVVANYISELTMSNKVFAFYGSMGSGKTTLISKIVEIIFCKPIEVTSPTFSLVNVYSDTTSVYHFDCYRLENELDAINAGLEEMLYDDKLCFVEWPENISNLLPQDCVKVNIFLTEDENKRNFEIITI